MSADDKLSTYNDNLEKLPKHKLDFNGKRNSLIINTEFNTAKTQE